MGDLRRPHLRSGMPRRDVDHPVEGMVAAGAGLNLPLRVQQPQVAVSPGVGEESRLRPRLAGDAGQRERDLLDRGDWQVSLQLTAREGGGLLPVPHGLLEVDRSLP